jgi:hypothetical protein
VSGYHRSGNAVILGSLDSGAAFLGTNGTSGQFAAFGGFGDPERIAQPQDNRGLAPAAHCADRTKDLSAAGAGAVGRGLIMTLRFAFFLMH